MNKNWPALLFSVFIGLGLSACGGNDSGITKQNNTAVTTDGTNPAEPVAPKTKPTTTAPATTSTPQPATTTAPKS